MSAFSSAFSSAPSPAQAAGPGLSVAASELLLGGQKSGKSRRAEALAAAWLAAAPGREALLLATAWPHSEGAGGDEMRQRIARHQRDRALRAPGLRTQKAWADLPAALAASDAPQRLRVVDCLSVWLAQLMLPPPGFALPQPPDWPGQVRALLAALAASAGPVVLVSQEIGLGVIPLGRETRAFVDALGGLNQQVAAHCQRVCFMAAGLPLALKDLPAAPSIIPSATDSSPAAS